jgi:peptide/nickel transport system ATP-binding protein
MKESKQKMLEIQNLSTHFHINSTKLFQKLTLKAVENVSFSVASNRVVGLVGESGCGKSTLGKTILGLTKSTEGKVLYEDKNLLTLSNREFLPYRKNLQIIFQDPYSSLNPRMTIFEILTEGLLHHKNIPSSEARSLSIAMLEKVGMKSDILERYPHEFSGGQRQRIAIARTLILEPKFIVCDEVSSALDVSNQAQVINLLNDFKSSMGLSLLFISHDLKIVSYISDEIAIMYLGKIVEYGNKSDILNSPHHPYTFALFSSVYDIHNRKKKRYVVKGEIPGVVNKPKGCYFHTRCPIAKDICKEVDPPLKNVSGTHKVYCHFPGEIG